MQKDECVPSEIKYCGLTFEINSKDSKSVTLKHLDNIFGQKTMYRSTNPFLPQEKVFIIPKTIKDSNGIEYIVTQIAEGAFDNLPVLEVIHVPDSLEFFEWGLWKCKNLRKFTVDSNNKKYMDIDGVLYNKSRHSLCAYPNKHGTEYRIPEGTREISSFAFKTCDIESLYCPKSLTHIKINVFYRCKHLKNIYGLTDNLKEFGGFYGDYGDVNPKCHFESGLTIDLNDLKEYLSKK